MEYFVLLFFEYEGWSVEKFNTLPEAHAYCLENKMENNYAIIKGVLVAGFINE